MKTFFEGDSLDSQYYQRREDMLSKNQPFWKTFIEKDSLFL